MRCCNKARVHNITIVDHGPRPNALYLFRATLKICRFVRIRIKNYDFVLRLREFMTTTKIKYLHDGGAHLSDGI